MAQSGRTIRVYVSSTFRDMHAERDYLHKIVFPELRERIATLNLNLVVVDQRCDVSEDKADIDLSYKRFLELITLELLEKSVVLYTYASWEVRSDRNTGRTTTSYARNVERQSFYVPTDAMESFFRTDDFEQVRELFPCPVFTIDNEKVLKNEFEQQVDNFVKTLR